MGRREKLGKTRKKITKGIQMEVQAGKKGEEKRKSKRGDNNRGKKGY